jgi:hypothetical protein
MTEKDDNIVLWRRLDRPGHEAVRIERSGELWLVTGTSVFDGDRPCSLSYVVVCDSAWRTLSASVSGFIGHEIVKVDILVVGGRWQLNGKDCPQVAGCIDVDLNFSPSTNTLPVRRLNLEVGKSASVRAAWLRFPTLTLEPLDQTYTRAADKTYRYVSGGGSFTADLLVNPSGLVLEYPGFFTREGG